MQIHEITRGNNRRQTQLDEGLWDTIKGAAKDFAGSKWLNSTAQAQAQQDSKLAKQSKDYVNTLTKQWMSEGPKLLVQQFNKKYGQKLARGEEITPEEQQSTFKETFGNWVAQKMITHVGNTRLTVPDVIKRVPEAQTTLPQLLNQATKDQSESTASAYIAQSLGFMQNLSKEIKQVEKEKEQQRQEKRYKSVDDTMSGADEEAEREFEYTDPETNTEIKIEVVDGEYRKIDPETKKEIPVTDEEEIDRIADQDPSVEENLEEIPDDSELAQVKTPEELTTAAKQVAIDTSDKANVPESNHDFRVISFTPSLIIRYKNQEFMMDDENYPQRDWYKLPNGTPVKNEPLIRLLNNFATEAFDKQDIMSGGGEGSSDIDVGADENAGVRVEPGTKLRLLDPRNNGVYYKDALGNWSTEEGRRLKKPETIKYLEKKVKTDGQSRVEKVLPPTPEEKKKGATA